MARLPAASGSAVGAGPADNEEDDDDGSTLEEPDDVSAVLVIVKLFCEMTLRDLTSGGFLMDAEKAKPRRRVALGFFCVGREEMYGR